MDDEPAEATPAAGAHSAVVVIAPRGDVVLDVAVSSKMASSASAFRVASAMLTNRSRYFANLLGDTRFHEARTVQDALAALTLAGVQPGDADDNDDRLPRVHIDLDDDDDGGSSSTAAERRLIFGELLRILHWDGKVEVVSSGEQTKSKPSPSPSPSTSKPTKSTTRGKTAAAKKTQPTPRTDIQQAVLPGSRWSAKTPPTLQALATLAVQADRFACTEAVAAYVRTVRIRFPSPVVSTQGGKALVKGMVSNGLPRMTNEDAIRQKVYVAWRLEQPLRFHTGTRELILYGSQQWAAALAGEDLDGFVSAAAAPWWELPDSIESELQFRRACIVNCIASVPRHFLRLYTSRNRNHRHHRNHHHQCTMGYETSAACDSFQLGEIVKFLYSKDLIFLQDVSCSLMSANANRRDRRRRVAPADYAAVDVAHILATLRQCPAYQLDKHHVNCGLRTRLLPILDYIQAMLGATSLGLHRHEWVQASHGTASWLAAAEDAGLFDDDGGGGGGGEYDDVSDDGSGGDDASAVPLFGKPRSTSGTNTTPSKHAPKEFRFTRAVAGDPRLRMAGGMAASAMARDLFTARRWNWTPEGYEK